MMKKIAQTDEHNKSRMQSRDNKYSPRVR